MKYLLIACLCLLAVTPQVLAQEKATVEMSKEKKAALKKMKEEHLTASFREAGISAAQEKLIRAAMEAANEKSNALKADKTLSEEERNTRKKAINEEKNNLLKEILGDQYKSWNEIRKKQKKEEEAYSATND